MCKKEWGIVRYLRQHLNTKFEYNTNKMLHQCLKVQKKDLMCILN
jgi:hypothetical protein